MKKFIYFLLIGLTSCNCLNRKKTEQSLLNGNFYSKPIPSFNGDTTSYIIKHFIENKQTYIGKEFSFFLRELNIPIKMFFSYPNYYSTNYSFISIRFYSKEEINLKIKNKINPRILTITWEKEIPAESMNSLIISTQNNWTPEVSEFFSKRKIKNIQMVDYGF